MIKISLDEGGNFERINTPRCMFVGGIVFSYEEFQDYNKEITRLQNFFIDTCTKQGCSYPDDLHYDRDKDNSGNVHKVKRALLEKLPDFINGQGDWSNNKPNGTYYLYALVGDKKGIESFTKNGISNLIDDNVSCNRYEHMAYRVVENLLFYNPCLLDNSVDLDLATRSIPINNDQTFENELKTTGHEKHEQRENLYRVTDQSSFRAAIATMIQDSNRSELQFKNVRVQSINYNESDSNLYQGFLYLSDTICSLYTEILKGCKDVESGIELVLKKCTERNLSEIFVWSYNEFDQQYRALYKAFENGDYYNSLRGIYKLSKENKSNYNVYEELWFSKIKAKISNSDDLQAFKTSITQLDKDLSYSDDLTVEEARYVFDLLKRRTINLCTQYNTETLLFSLYKAEMTINNHEGNYEQATKSFEECMKYSQYVNVEEYLELRNMQSVSLCDSDEFKQAVDFTKETLSYEELLVNIKKEIYKENDKIFIHYGRTLSQLGQCYAFNKEYKSAIDCFKKAIEAFGKNRIEITRTLSYLLHTLIEANDRPSYEKYAKEYFGTSDRTAQLEKLLSTESISNSFGLYFYIKAYYIFYANQEKQKIEDFLNKMAVCKKYKYNTSHPWEMIFKYLAFLCILSGNNKYIAEAEKYIELAKRIKCEGIIEFIVDEIDSQFKSVQEGKNAFEDSILTFMYR